MGRQIALVAVGLAFIAGGLFAGFQALEVGESRVTECGSFFKADRDTPRFADSAYEVVYGEESTERTDACNDARSGRQVPTYGLLGLGAVALIGALIAPTSRRSERPSPR